MLWDGDLLDSAGGLWRRMGGSLGHAIFCCSVAPNGRFIDLAGGFVEFGQGLRDTPRMRVLRAQSIGKFGMCPQQQFLGFGVVLDPSESAA